MKVPARTPYLPAGLPSPVDEEGVCAPYWAGLRAGRLMVQRCDVCGTTQFGGEWICHACHAFDPPWVEVPARGRIYSWERVWHPVHPALAGHGPYLAVLVELAQAAGVRMLGNLLGDPMQDVTIGAEVEGVYEHHEEGYSLLQWRLR